MMDLLILLLVAALSAGCGYLGGRWHAGYKQAHLQAKLESDTSNFMRMLEERNQDYLHQKQQIDRARAQYNENELGLSRAQAQIEQEQEKYLLLQQQLEALQEKQERMRVHYAEMEEQRQHFREANIVLESEAKKTDQKTLEVSRRNDLLEEKFSTALVEKTRLQTDMINKDRELQELRTRLIKQEDLNESVELTLDQMRSKRDEMTQQLAHTQGQLAILKQSAPRSPAESELQQLGTESKQNFI